MRIAYVSLHWPRTTTSGVGKKINQQISYWQNFGNDVRLFMHTYDYQPVSELLNGSMFRYRRIPGFAGKLVTEIFRILAANKMLRGIREYNPDIIYLRMGMYTFPLHHICKLAPLVSEINTNDVKQHRLLGKALSTYNQLTRSILLTRSRGLVFVSSELSSTREYSRFKKPSLVLSNGYDLDEVPQLPPPNNEIPHLVFIGSPDCPWHGVEKLVPFARSHQNIVVDIIGYDHIYNETQIPKNLILHGYLKRQDYQIILGEADAAIGSLSLHKLGIYEASPLKTRECLSYGLPLVIPYHDTDLNDLYCDFLLKIPNREDNLLTHGDAIVDFLYKVRGKRALREQVRSRISIFEKERMRLDFFQEIRKLTNAVS